MRDKQHAAGKIAQQFLEPFDAVDVEMVGRLVEQQQFGLDDQRAASAVRFLWPPDSASTCACSGKCSRETTISTRDLTRQPSPDSS